MHFLIGLGILAGFVWFAFGAGTARVFVGIVLAIPVLLGLFFVTGELTRGLDGVAFSKLYKADAVAMREIEQERAERDAELAEEQARREAEAKANRDAEARRVELAGHKFEQDQTIAAWECVHHRDVDGIATNGHMCSGLPRDKMAVAEKQYSQELTADLMRKDPKFAKQAEQAKRECLTNSNLVRSSNDFACEMLR
ncbi:hypothetical protein [Bradyrhizobium sp. WSM1417]|uniref:hypothetical protein n=1 Tax=Bradyrhizobium sp. WSM1417 TaxID=754500 RepID=UPI000484030F|nr:hypothetical protein [Bradyrhizobium sp. WSM1417]